MDIQKVQVAPPTKTVLPPREAKYQPAASNTDSPSRGIPTPSDDPNKQITGGFGVAGPPQYFPLDGSELKEAVRSLLDKINARLDNDLRFHPAMTYPRVAVVVSVTIQGYGQDEPYTLDAKSIHDKTPVETAVAVGAAPVDFTVQEQLREFAEDGTPENPPDYVRDSLGLEKPRKQFVEMAGGRQLVDVRPTLLDSF